MRSRALSRTLMLCLGLAACAPVPGAVPPAPPPPPPAALPALEELLQDYAANCAGPEGMDACDPEHFEETFRDKLPAYRAHRDALVASWMRSLDGGAHSSAYGLSWAGEKRAIPALRRGLLADRSFYGWESSDAATLEARMRDDQYPSQMARIMALEKLGGAPVRAVVALTPRERAALVNEAFEPGEPGGSPDVARWLLHRLAPEALSPRAAAPPSGLAPATVAPGLSGFVLAAHDFPHHDLAVLARIDKGRIEAVEQKVGCRVLPRARAFSTDPARLAPIALGATTFSNAANSCLAEVSGLAKGDFVATIGIRAVAEPVELAPETRALLRGLALEALLRVRGAEPADFVGEATVSAVRYPGGVRAVVAAKVVRRAAGDSEGEGAEAAARAPVCVSSLCEVKPWSTGVPSASLVAVYEVMDEHPEPRERLLLASAGGGCGPEQDDVVRFTGFAAIEGAEPFVVVSRSACDGWHYELYAMGPAGVHLVASGASGSRI